MRDIDRQIEGLRDARGRNQSLAAARGEVRGELANALEQYEECERGHALIRRELARLSGWRWRNIVYTLLSKKQEAVRELCEGLVVCKQELDDRARRVEALEQREKELSRELYSEGDLEERLVALLNEKQAQLLRRAGPSSAVAEHLEGLARRVELQQTRIATLDQARAHAQRAIRQLGRSEGELEKARGWGFWDLLGGGLVTTLVKHSHVDSGSKHVETAREHLKRLRAELAKLSIEESIAVGLEPINKVADVFLDGIYDWFAQSKIVRSRDGVRAALQKTRRVEAELEASLQAAERGLVELESERRTVINRA